MFKTFSTQSWFENHKMFNIYKCQHTAGCKSNRNALFSDGEKFKIQKPKYYTLFYPPFKSIEV